MSMSRHPTLTPYDRVLLLEWLFDVFLVALAVIGVGFFVHGLWKDEVMQTVLGVLLIAPSLSVAVTYARYWSDELSAPGRAAVDEMVGVLTGGSDAQIVERVFGGAGPGGVPEVLRPLRDPGSSGRPEVLARRTAGRFTLVVVRLPWLDDPADPAAAERPLLLTIDHGRVKVAGLVSPFEGVAASFTAADWHAVTRLSAWWKDWQAVERAAQSKPGGR
jgi:hypothetical protein